ncbi:MAG: carboxypeptidase-like regulatory domain-containing protein, partial [Bacteroidota bacterium]
MGISLLFLCQLSFAQQTYSGYILDKETGEPLVGATVVVIGSTNGVMAQDRGYFELKSTAVNPKVMVNFLGYKRKELVLTESGPIEVNLEPSDLSLDGVVITGLGIKRQQREIGYSTDYVSGDKIALSNAPNVINALSGLSAGVQV